MHKASIILKENKVQLALSINMFEWLKRNNTRVKDIRYFMYSITTYRYWSSEGTNWRKRWINKGREGLSVVQLGSTSREYIVEKPCLIPSERIFELPVFYKSYNCISLGQCGFYSEFSTVLAGSYCCRLLHEEQDRQV